MSNNRKPSDTATDAELRSVLDSLEAKNLESAEPVFDEVTRDTRGTIREGREFSEREAFERPQTWQPPTAIPEPNKQPGFAYRWVRASVLKNGEPDPANMLSKRREGWEPVRVEEQPQFKGYVDSDGRFQDTIEVNGLVLCKCPEELMAQRAAHFQQQNRIQIQSVDQHYMREQNTRMPKFNDSTSRVSKFGDG